VKRRGMEARAGGEVHPRAGGEVHRAPLEWSGVEPA